MVRGALGRLDAERRVATSAAAAGDVIAALGAFRQREEAVIAAEKRIDERLRNAVIPDDDESVALVRGTESGGERKAVDVSQAEARNCIGHPCILHANGAAPRYDRAANEPDRPPSDRPPRRPPAVSCWSSRGLSDSTRKPRASNALQHRPDSRAESVQAAALREFKGLRQALDGEGVQVIVTEDSAEPLKPDALFPNNWVSFHADGTVVLYPMLAPNRRAERRREIVDQVIAESGCAMRRLLDFTAHEDDGRFLEGTGSLVLDHVGRVAYACRSPRTDAALVGQWCAEMGYRAVVFDATDVAGAPYYHTNVMLSIGSDFAVLAVESIASGDRDRVRGELRDAGRRVVEISRAAVAGFAGNVLELATWDEALGDARVLVMSKAARAALGEAQYRQLAGAVDAVLVVPVPTIERVGGGSVRCMIAEVFLATPDA